MNINVPVAMGVRGFFKLEKISEDGTVTEAAPWQENLILDNFLDFMGNSPSGGIVSPTNRCHVGTGNTAPAASQTALDAEVAIASINSSSFTRNASSPYEFTWIGSFDFPIGTFNGDILAEIGLGPASAGTDGLSTRALISPTVTVLSTELLRVTYGIEMRPPLSDQVVVADGYTFTIRAARAGTADWEFDGENGNSRITANIVTAYSTFTLGTITSAPTTGGSQSNADTITTTWPTTSQANMSCYWNTSSGNFNIAGFYIRQLLSANCLEYQLQASVSPTINKTNLQELTVVFSMSWARV